MLYGFLDGMIGARQQDGFFIDQSNRILYWPAKGRPGFVLDEKTAVDMIAANRRSQHLGTLIGTLAAMLLWGAQSWLMAAVYPYISSIFSSSGAVLAFVHVLIVFVVVAAVVFGRQNAAKRSRHLLSLGLHQVLDQPRPRPLVLRPSETMAKAYLVLMGVGGPAVIVVFIFLAFNGDTLLGDRWALLLLVVLMVWGLTILVWQQATGVKTADIWWYQVQDQGASGENSAANPARGKFWRLVDWAFSGWRVWVVVPVLGIAIGIGYVEFKKTPLSADILVAQYRQAAFPSDADVAMKWTGPVTVCLGPSAENDLRAAIEDSIQALTKVAGLSAAFGQTPCSVTVSFVQSERLAPDGQPDPIGGRFNHAQGVLRTVEIEVSLISLAQLAPEEVFANRHSRQTLVRKVADIVGLWSLGFRGIPTFAETYTDRQGQRLLLPQAMAAIHYDARIKPGMGAPDSMTQASLIAETVLDGRK